MHEIFCLYPRNIFIPSSNKVINSLKQVLENVSENYNQQNELFFKIEILFKFRKSITFWGIWVLKECIAISWVILMKLYFRKPFAKSRNFFLQQTVSDICNYLFLFLFSITSFYTVWFRMSVWSPFCDFSGSSSKLGHWMCRLGHSH